MELTKLCRICLIKCENQITHSIFCEETILKLSLCGGLIVDKNMNLPGQMCDQCFKSLENAHQFRISCQISENRINEYFQKNSISSKKNKNDLIAIKNVLALASEKLEEKCNCHQETLNLKIKFPNNIENLNYTCKLETKTNLLDNLPLGSNSVKVEIEPKDITINRKYNKKKVKEKMEKTINDNLICEICQVCYKAKNAFIYHMRRHRNEMDFICEICGNVFETNFKLSRHLLQHTGIKKYPCRTCEKSFPTSSNRDRHERRLHTNIRPFQCEYCIKVFAYSDQLKNHIRVHTGEKPFVCEKCGTGFKRKSHLITHKKAITPCFLKNKEIKKNEQH